MYKQYCKYQGGFGKYKQIGRIYKSTIPVGEVTDDKVKMVTFSLGF